MARDRYGVFIAASCATIPYVADAFLAEAMAMKSRLILAESLGYTSIQIESDALEVVNACSGQERMWSEATAIYADCFIIAGMIGNVEFTHCRWEANEAAHNLAKFSYENNVSCNWVDEPPDFLINSLVNEDRKSVV